MVIQIGYMDTRTATLIVRYKNDHGTWKRAAAVRRANGRIRPGYALINGTETQVREFQYQVRYYENRKPHYRPAGKKAASADALRDRTEKQHSVKAAAEAVGVKVEVEEDRRNLSGSAAAYILDAQKRGAAEAAEQARLSRISNSH